MSCEPGRSRLEYQYLLVLLLLCLTLGVAYAVVTPAFGGPDEDAHWDYVRLVWDTRGDPALMASTPAPAKSVRGHAPTYYWMVASSLIVSSGQPEEVQIFFGRMVSLALLLGEVLLAYLTARLLSPHDRFVRLAAPAIVALLPGRLWMGSVISNDNLAAFSSAALLYIAARMILRGFSRGSMVALAVFLVVAVASKPTAWAVVAAVGLALAVVGCHRCWRTRRFPFWGFALSAATLCAALVAGGLLARGQLERYVPRLESMWVKLHAIPTPEPEPFAHQWKSFWLPLWVADAMPPEPVYWLGAIVVLPAAVGLVLWLAGVNMGKPAEGQPTGGRKYACVAMLGLASIGVWTLSLLQHLSVVAGTASFSVTRDIWPPTHARYLFPALLPFACFVALGLSRIAPRRSWPIGLAILLALFLCLNGVALYSMITHTYFWSS